MVAASPPGRRCRASFYSSSFIRVNADRATHAPRLRRSERGSCVPTHSCLPFVFLIDSPRGGSL